MRPRGACVALLLLFASSALVAVVRAEDDDGADDDYADAYRAHLIVAKTVVATQNSDLAYPLVVQGRNVTIDVALFNSGDGCVDLLLGLCHGS
jgi:hypothetical protein